MVLPQLSASWAQPCHSFLRFATLRDLSWLMNDKTIPSRTLERKKREAAALKANMKKRKEQAKLSNAPLKPPEFTKKDQNE